MLTPLGSGARSSRARRWPRLLLAILVVAAVAAAAVGAWWWFTQRADSPPTPTASPSRTCTTPTPKPPKNLPSPDEITVDVGNGTDRPGLALDTADALAARGFVVGSIGNADKPVKSGVALVRYDKGSLPDAVVVASYVPGATLVEVQSADTGAVQLWLGPDFDKVADSDVAEPDSVALPPGDPVCTKVRLSS